jgi:hypothetical protein
VRVATSLFGVIFRYFVRPVKFHQLEPSMAVWGFQHGDLHADALEAHDAVYPVTFDRRFADHCQAELDEELGRGSEVGNHDAHVLQTLNRHPTLLPDGRWLLLGGQGPNGPVAGGTFFDPKTGNTTSAPWTLVQPRAWHTATLLPDGAILVVGGMGAGSHVLGTAELFDQPTQAFYPIANTALTARAQHTATLLTDGFVLIAGGVSSTGQVLAQAAPPQCTSAASSRVERAGLGERHPRRDRPPPSIGRRAGRISTNATSRRRHNGVPRAPSRSDQDVAAPDSGGAGPGLSPEWQWAMEWRSSGARREEPD